MIIRNEKGQFVKGMTHEVSKEARLKISKGNKGKIKSKEARLKMSISKKESIENGTIKIWNKGLKGVQISNMKGKKHTEYSKNKLSETMKKLYREGKIIPYNKGRKFSEKHRRRISESRIGKYCGKENAFYGKYHTEETKLKLSKINKGKIGWNKGKHFSEESRKKMSLAKKGKKLSLNHRKKLSEIHKKLFLQGKLPKNVGALGKDNPSWLGGKSFEPYNIN